jgi:hypothetical protein
MPNDFAEETDDPRVADVRNFYKVELWNRNGQVERLLHAGNRLDRAVMVFESQKRRRPASRLTIRQRARVLRKWPDA